jgi:hypothetical protein
MLKGLPIERVAATTRSSLFIIDNDFHFYSKGYIFFLVFHKLSIEILRG